MCYLHATHSSASKTGIMQIHSLTICVSILILTGIVTNGHRFQSYEGICRFSAALCIITCACSIWTMLAISINRYMCICHHVLYLDVFNKKTMPFFVLAVWVISVLLDSPVMLGWGKHGYNPRSLHCALDYTTGYDYRLFLLFVGFGFPLNGLLFCYTKIYFYAKSTQDNLKKYQENEPGVKKSSAIKPSDIKLLRSILIIVIMFVTLWAPYAIILLFDTALYWPRSVLITAVCMAHVSSMVNSIIYAATNKNFRDGYVHLLKVCFCYYRFCASDKERSRKGFMIASVDGTQSMKAKRTVSTEKNGTNI